MAFDRKSYMKKYNKMYRELNSDKLNQYDKDRWRNSETRRIKHNQVGKRYRDRQLAVNPDEYYKKCREAVYKSYHSNLERGRAVKRKAQMKRLDNERFVDVNRKEVMELFDYTCFNCGSKDNLTLDHHIPLSRGGKMIKNNAVVLCRSCNSSKYNKTPEDFYSKCKLKELYEYLGS